MLPADPAALVDAVLRTDQRVLLVGQPGIGKSTLVRALAKRLGEAGRSCWCIGADPGSPLFGVPGAVCLGRWQTPHWLLEALEALCTLDAGRFRLPLVAAVARLAQPQRPGVLLVDGPGVVRGIAGAELLPGIVQAAAIDVVVAVTRKDCAVPLAAELGALASQYVVVEAATEAQRPGKRVRARTRTSLWDVYLDGAAEQALPLKQLRVVGTPPPLDSPDEWPGRQIALLRGERMVAMGEALALQGGMLRARLAADASEADTLLIRDAARGADGHLGTSARFAADRLDYLPPPDVVPQFSEGDTGGPRVFGRVGALSISLINGVFGDPLLHARLRHARRSLLFDLGEGSRLPARVAHQVSDVFITHAHIDHIAGFLWLLRSRIGEFPVCRIYGPPDLARNIAGLTSGILWDRVADRGPRFEVFELHETQLLRFMVQGGRSGCDALGERPASDGLLHREPGFQIRATTLEHVSPVLAYAFEPDQQINVRKDRLRARGMAPGPWLGELKRQLQAQALQTDIQLPDGTTQTTEALAADLVLISPGKKLVYATDFRDSAENRRRLITLARNAHTFFCESTFLEQDAEQAARTAHLTTRACAEIAAQAGVARLVPFHFSRRYEDDPGQIYQEIAARCAAVAIPKSVSPYQD